MSQLNKQKFMSMFNEILGEKNGANELSKLLKTSVKGDDVDTLNHQKEQALNMRLDQRNILFLKKVEEAKQKILDGTYGECEDCGTNISQKRLLARPTASLCIECQEEKEMNEFGNFNKRRDLNNKKFNEENIDDHIVKTDHFKSVNDITFESVVDL